MIKLVCIVCLFLIIALLLNIKREKFQNDETVLKHKFYMFYASWCRYSIAANPEFLKLQNNEEVSALVNDEKIWKLKKNIDGKNVILEIEQIDIDENADFVKTFSDNIEGYPTFLLIDHNNNIDTYSGERSMEKMLDWLKNTKGYKNM